MSKDLAYWERKLADAKTRLPKLRSEAARSPKPEPTREGKSLHIWWGQHQAWIKAERDRRRLVHRVKQLEARIPFYEGRIVALMNTTMWDRVRRGVAL